MVMRIGRSVVGRAKRFFGRAYMSMVQFETDLKFPSPPRRPEVAGSYIVISSIAELDRFKEAFTADQYELYKEWLAEHQDRMLAFVSDGRLVSWGWFSTRRRAYYEPAIRREIAIPDEASFHFDAHTIDTYRRKGIYAASFYEYPFALKGLGKKKVILLIRSRDQIPLANAEKLRFKRITKYYVLNLGIFYLKFSKRSRRHQ